MVVGCVQAVLETGSGRDINRHKYTEEEAEAALKQPVVKALLDLCKFRNTHQAFTGQVLCLSFLGLPCLCLLGKGALCVMYLHACFAICGCADLAYAAMFALPVCCEVKHGLAVPADCCMPNICCTCLVTLNYCTHLHP